MHKNSSNSAHPVQSAVLHRSVGNAQPHVPAKSESDPPPLDLLQGEGYCHTWIVPSVLGRLRKNNITQYNMKIKQAILHSSSIFNRINFKKGRK